MTILALEFSSTRRSVAVVRPVGPMPLAIGDRLPRKLSGGRTLSALAIQSCRATQIFEAGGPPTKPFSMIAEALQAAGVEREQIECVAVGLGPGSYSGIRSAIALAQGWQLARDCKLLGVSSVECIAAQAQADGLEGRIDIVLDAQRQEFYLAIYHVGPSGFRELEPLRLASLAQVQARKREGALLVGPEATRWFPDGRLIFPTASMIGRLVLGRTDYVSGETLEPIYLRQTNFVKAPPPRQPRSSS